MTKAQTKTTERLEARGYDHGYTQADGNPVMVLRAVSINNKPETWVEILRNGSYRPVTEITIAPVNPVTIEDKMEAAYSQINSLIDATDGGRLCSTPSWSIMQDCRRSIRQAMQMIHDGK